MSDDPINRIIMAVRFRPDDFSLDRDTLEDRKTGVEIWVNCGPLGYGLWRPEKIKFNIIQSIRFHMFFRKYKKLKKHSSRKYKLDLYTKKMLDAK